jgi:hypothetical protein
VGTLNHNGFPVNYMQKLVFSDTEMFYLELKTALEQGEQVDVITNYEQYSDLPEQLKTIFELHKNKSESWVNVNTGAFVASSVVATSINYSALYILSAAVAGAIVGAFVGPIGAAVGSGIGACIGVVAVVAVNGKHHVDIEIDVSGKLRLRIIPIH